MKFALPSFRRFSTVATGTLLALALIPSLARAEPGRADFVSNRMLRADIRTRLHKAILALFPIYAGLTILLWILLLVAGDSSLTALCHAMSTMATD